MSQRALCLVTGYRKRARCNDRFGRKWRIRNGAGIWSTDRSCPRLTREAAAVCGGAAVRGSGGSPSRPAIDGTGSWRRGAVDTGPRAHYGVLCPSHRHSGVAPCRSLLMCRGPDTTAGRQAIPESVVRCRPPNARKCISAPPAPSAQNGGVSWAIPEFHHLCQIQGLPDTIRGKDDVDRCSADALTPQSTLSARCFASA